MRLIPVHDLKEKLDKGEEVLIVDMRDPEDYEFCHIAGSINVTRKDFDAFIPKVPHDIPVVFICKYGKKSEQVVVTLRNEHAHKNVYSLLGGLWEWAKEIDPSMIVW
ncbi:MAG TPA: rhodanese-like domain-containing protein [Bacteroidales bacterium]|nr:rhodanese-like domain-containing protein [Bacteroidales bacterium]HSA44397.1 rhodanese-like domain-containing protein [Bacteroidales bacterium]